MNLADHIAEKRWREVFLLSVTMLDNAEYFLRLIKIKIDSLLEKDSNIQNFLGSIYECSLSFNSSYRPEVIRAFQFALNHTLSKKLKYVQSLKYARDSALNYTSGLSVALAHDFITQLDRALELALSCASELILALDIGLASALERDLNIECTLPIHFAIAFDSELQQKLQELRIQLPLSDKYSPTKLSQWWKINGSSWATQLISLLDHHGNWEIEWHFTDEQNKLLQQYYDANKLLVDCLNSDCYVSREVRKEIEDTLLLPIAEIEKYKAAKAAHSND